MRGWAPSPPARPALQGVAPPGSQEDCEIKDLPRTVAAAGQLGTGSRGGRVGARLPLTSPALLGPRTCANTSSAGPPGQFSLQLLGPSPLAHPAPKARSVLGQDPCSLNCGSPG